MGTGNLGLVLALPLTSYMAELGFLFSEVRRTVGSLAIYTGVDTSCRRRASRELCSNPVQCDLMPVT